MKKKNIYIHFFRISIVPEEVNTAEHYTQFNETNVQLLMNTLNLNILTDQLWKLYSNLTNDTLYSSKIRQFLLIIFLSIE